MEIYGNLQRSSVAGDAVSGGNRNNSMQWQTPFSAPPRNTQQQSNVFDSGMTQTHEAWRSRVNHLKKFFGDEYSPKQPYSTSNFRTDPLNSGARNFTHTNYHQQSGRTLLDAAMQKAYIRDRCPEISKALSSMSVLELRDVFPHILYSIFGYESAQGWGLHYLEPRINGMDFNAAFEFLLPDGGLFNAIDKLMTDDDAVFQLPFNVLPPGIREAIMKNQVPLWYQSKIVSRPGNSAVVNMSAFEFYFALFAHFMSHPRTLQQGSDWSGVEDVLYVCLLEKYLCAFLPLYDGVNFQSISPSSSPANSPKQPQQHHSALKSTLWKSSDLRFAVETNTMHTQTHFDHFQHLPSKAEIFLQVITDFWLSFNSEEYIQQEESYRLPSFDHARMVRIMIKYIHTFHNATKSPDSRTFAGDHSDLEEFKDIIPAILHDKLYTYLNHCFNHWPLDRTFRMVLETWLSFIQPWRYQNKNSSSEESMDLIDTTSNWMNFIMENNRFYTNLMRTFLLRAMKHDLVNLDDVVLIYRVCKVFSQPALMKILQEGMEDASLDTSTTYTSSNRYNRITVSARLPTSHLLLSSDMKQAQELCNRLSSTLIGFRHKILTASDKKKHKDASGVFSFLKDLFIVEDVNLEQQKKEQKLIEYLDHSYTMLADLFKITKTETMPEGELNDGDNVMTSAIPRLNLGASDLPDHRIGENGIELTDRGRYEIIQGMRRFEFVYSGDPEFQPIRSYESAKMIRLLFRLSMYLNRKYSASLKELYNRQDFVGISLNKLSKGLDYPHYEGSAIKPPKSAVKGTLHAGGVIVPRITLRFAASYFFMGYVCWGIVLARLFDCGWMFITLVVLLLLLLSVLYHVDCPPKKPKEN